MDFAGLLILLAIAAVAGAVGQSLAGFSLGGCLVTSGVGLLGAFIGLSLARQLGLPEPLPITIQGENFPLLWAIVGSAVFALALRLVLRGRQLL